MDIEIFERNDNLTRLALRGRLDTPGVDQVETKFSAALTHGGHGVVDMSEVTFLSSMGIRMLLTAAKTAARRGGRMVLVGPQPLVKQSLEHAALDEILPVAPDVDGALALLGS